MPAKPDQPWPQPVLSGPYPPCDHRRRPSPTSSPVKRRHLLCRWQKGQRGPGSQDSLPGPLSLLSPLGLGCPGTGHSTRGEVAT